MKYNINCLERKKIYIFILETIEMLDNKIDL